MNGEYLKSEYISTCQITEQSRFVYANSVCKHLGQIHDKTTEKVYGRNV